MLFALVFLLFFIFSPIKDLILYTTSSFHKEIKLLFIKSPFFNLTAYLTACDISLKEIKKITLKYVRSLGFDGLQYRFLIGCPINGKRNYSNYSTLPLNWVQNMRVLMKSRN